MKRRWKLRLSRRALLKAGLGGGLLATLPPQLANAASPPAHARLDVRSRQALPEAGPQLQQAGATASILVLVDSAAGNPFGAYYTEILALEGVSDVEVQNLSGLTAATIADRAAVILAEATPSPGQVTILSDYVNSGGGLIAMRPAASLDTLLGVSRQSTSLTNGYMRLTDQSIGDGLFADTLQFHGTSGHYNLAGATQLAELYSSRDSSTGLPAVTVSDAGQGRAAMFSFDLARSIALTRQGNPANADIDVDGDGAVRSIDIYNGWTDLERAHVPQADMQIRLLARLIETVSRRPLPRLWYFPGTAPCVFVPTGDAHANPQSYYQRMVDELGARGVGLTFFLAPTGPSPEILSTWMSQGFDFAPHPYADGDYQQSYQAAFADFINDYGFQPRTARTHMVRWTGWSSAASIQAAVGVEMNFDSYQWGQWLDLPGGPARGYVSGSGLPMRFVTESGQILPIYQQHTSLVDEELAPGPGVSGISYAEAVAISHQTIDDAMMFHTAVATQFHVDYYAWGDVNPWVLDTTDYALASGATPLTADAWLTFVKARATTSITNIGWTASSLNFDVVAGGPSQTLLLPIEESGAALIEVQHDGAPVTYSVLTMSGRDYAAVPVVTGAYQATYQPDTVGPVISNIAITPGSEQATIAWTTDELATSIVDYGTTQSLDQQASSGALVISHSLEMEELTPSTTYYYRVSAADASDNNSSSDTMTFQTLPPEAPLLLTISPSSNQAGAQQVVTLTGQNFVAGATVSFDSQPLVNVLVLSETSIHATVPASMTAGTYDVTVTNPDGQFSMLPGGYQVLAPPPSLAEVSPSIVTAGGTITLTGQGFIAGATVQIGSISAQNVTFINSQQLSAAVPASLAAGLYSVTVTNPDSLSDTLDDVLTVSPLPSVGHTTVADFTPGVLNGTAIRSGGDAGDGAVALASSGWLENFVNATLDPARWASGTWQVDGSVVINPGQLQVTGAWVESQEVFTQGRVAARLTFEPGEWLSFGFSRSDTIANPWFLFGVPGWDTSQVYARYNFGSTVGDVPLGDFTGAPHDFAIEYLPGQSVRFLVDGDLLYERAITTTNQLAIWLSAGSTGPVLTAHSIEVASFAPSGTYLSPALDAGERAAWAQLLIDRSLPGGTDVTARARSSIDAAAWSDWSPAATTFPADLSLPEGRYLQYELALSTTNPAATSLVEAVNATYQEGDPLVVSSVTISPSDTTVAPNTTQQFTAQAFDTTGQPIPGASITWSVVNGGGTIDQNGLFTAGTVTGSFTDTIVASASGVTDSASVTVQALAAPQMTSISPTNAEPGATVTIAGANFVSGATVDVGATGAVQVTFVSASQLTFEVPALVTGIYDVTVANPDGQFSTLAGGLTVTVPIEIVETTEADFGLGTLNGTVLDANDDGEIGLQAIYVESFDGTQLSADWTSGDYDPAGVEGVSDGQLHVSGGWVQSATTYGPLSITARVTASANGQPFLNFGLGRSGALDYPWYLFGNTSWNPGGIYARSNDGGFYQDSLIAGIDPTEPHEYTVQRTTDQIIYKVDGQVVVTHNVESWGNTTPLAFWFSASRVQHQIDVDWIRIDQYLASGTYTSSPLDAGANTTWSTVAADVSLPPASGMSIRLRTSPDGTGWSDWSTAIVFDGSPFALAVPDGQYIQYELTLTSDGSASPEVRSLTLSGHTVV